MLCPFSANLSGLESEKWCRNDVLNEMLYWSLQSYGSCVCVSFSFLPRFLLFDIQVWPLAHIQKEVKMLQCLWWRELRCVFFHRLCVNHLWHVHTHPQARAHNLPSCYVTMQCASSFNNDPQKITQSSLNHCTVAKDNTGFEVWRHLWIKSCFLVQLQRLVD